jgi:hypothetical protein
MFIRHISSERELFMGLGRGLSLGLNPHSSQPEHLPYANAATPKMGEESVGC